MIANLLTVLIGLWLAYSAIFSVPAGEASNAGVVVAGIAVIASAFWARRTDYMGWQSGTSIVLGVIMLLLAATRAAIKVEPSVSFWLILLIGITVAIVAMWSMLYRGETIQSTASH